MPQGMTVSDFEARYQDMKQWQLIGSGGFADVYKALDLRNNHYVALKVSKVRPEMKQFTLLREFELASKLPTHSNICHYDSCYRFDSGIGGLTDIAVLKFYEYGNLEQFLKSQQLNENEQYLVIRGVLEGVAFLHENNCIHRDIKSQNVLLHREYGVWIPKITDFGLAREAFDEHSLVNSSVAVTYAFAAPEQIQGRNIHKNVDLWAVGVMIYRIVAGELPFKNSHDGSEHTASSQGEMMRRISNVELPKKLDALPQPYQSMIRRCLVLDPRNRAQSVGELISMLEAGRASASTQPLPPVGSDYPKAGASDATRPRSVSSDVMSTHQPMPPPQAAAPAPPSVPYTPPSYLPPTAYQTPKPNFTQVLGPNQPPMPPPQIQPRIGEPRRSSNWIWWVIIPLLLLGVGYGAYLLVNSFDETPTVVEETPVEPPPVPPAPTDALKPDTLMPAMTHAWEEAEAMMASATSWRSLYDSIGSHIHSASEHKFGHPEGYTMLVFAAYKAIKDGENIKMYEQMRRDVDNGAEAARLAKGHHHWEEVAMALRTRKIDELKHVINEVYENWQAILNGEGGLDEHHEEEHEDH